MSSVSSLPAAVALLMLDSIDPAGLGDKHAVLDYLRAAERIDAVTAALKARARVALAGAAPSGELMSELHVEHRVAAAPRPPQRSDDENGQEEERGKLHAARASTATPAGCRERAEPRRRGVPYALAVRFRLSSRRVGPDLAA